MSDTSSIPLDEQEGRPVTKPFCGRGHEIAVVGRDRQRRCKGCRRLIYDATNRVTNREKRKADNARWLAAHRDERRAYSAARHAANREENNARSLAYYHFGPGYMKQLNRRADEGLARLKELHLG